MEETDPYLSSYADISVHELMLRDRPRTLAYKNFIEKNRHLFEGKVVMDVGAGTGILSFFAARAGAKRVYAVECSGISHLCERLAERNRLSDVVHVLKGKVEEVTLDEKVDVIVSEWMGFYLFHESMLFSVLRARDRFLKPGGLILPSTGRLLACPTSLASAYECQTSFWRDVYGFDFGPAADLAMAQWSVGSEPLVEALEPRDLVSGPRFVTAVEMAHAEEGDFEMIRAELKFPVEKYGVVRGLALWFDVIFGEEEEEEEEKGDAVERDDPQRFSTSPKSPQTHWKQTTVVMPETKLVSPGDVFACRLSLKRNPVDRRKYLITLELPEETEDEEDDEDDDDWKDSVAEMIGDAIEMR